MNLMNSTKTSKTTPCEICNIDPKSHSFKIIPCNNPDINLFYSCPCEATKYFDSQGVINHFKLYLEQNNNQPWAYILDCKGFTLGHSTKINTSFEIVSMITNKYGKSLKKVWIINYTWKIKLFLSALVATLTKELKSIIETSDKTLEQIQEMTSYE
jgi:hypothetical protein